MSKFGPNKISDKIKTCTLYSLEFESMRKYGNPLKIIGFRLKLRIFGLNRKFLITAIDLLDVCHRIRENTVFHLLWELYRRFRLPAMFSSFYDKLDFIRNTSNIYSFVLILLDIPVTNFMSHFFSQNIQFPPHYSKSLRFRSLPIKKLL